LACLTFIDSANSPKPPDTDLVSGDIRLVWIFAGVLAQGGINWRCQKLPIFNAMSRRTCLPSL